MLENPSVKHVKRHSKEKRLPPPRMASPEDSESQYQSSEHQNQLKLLNSHLSIYNALTNPDLELSPNLKGNNVLTRFPSPAQIPLSPESNHEPKLSIDESWQSITNDLDSKFIENQRFMDHHAILRTLSNSPLFMGQSPGRPSSLLSITTDEEAQDAIDPLVVVPNSNSSFNVAESAMVFETDEETDDDSNEGEHKLDNTLIMPKVSMSSENSGSLKLLRVVLLSSSNVEYSTQASQLMEIIKNELEDKVKVDHLCITKQSFTKLNRELFKSANVVFIINDGSSIFHEYLKYASNESKNRKENTKIVIINMMTVNYFINLVNLITDFHPDQMWKTPSLNHGGLVMRLRCFMEGEMSGSLYSTSVELRPTIERSGSIYSSLTSVNKPNYKKLEKQFKAELSDPSHVDPLDLKKINFFNGLSVMIKNIAAYLKGDDSNSVVFNKPTVFAIAAFSLGISLGVSFNNFTKWAGIYFTNGLLDNKSAIFTDIKTEEALVPLFNYRDFKDTMKSSFVSAVKGIITELSTSLDQLLTTMKFASSLTVDYAKGGLDKLMQFVF